MTASEIPRAPEPLTSSHDLSAFDCGAPELNSWLRQRALKNEESGASRTYVVCVGQRVVGFYCLANGAITHAQASGKVRRNMPDPIPVMVIGRLAVDLGWHKKGMGRALLRDAVLRTVQAAELAGIRAMLVHAKSEQAKAFYESWGLHSSPVEPMTLMIPIVEARRVLGI
ncbi:MAG TPA: GNAT family N-acetyltransferase [Alphaproteobacteria bacterium]|nr:GNAT family N-acetyltransferase [Alphaproteobacteria bacterium]